MKTIARGAGAFAVVLCTLLMPAQAARAQTATAVEFYHAGLDHYFLTHVPAEIALLDAGTTIKGWTRTGQSFEVYASAASGTSPVCRFYIPPAKGDSHFYGRGTAECNATGAANPTFFNEDPNFFHVVLPSAGACPAGTRNVYRVFSNRPDANHRYAVERAIRDQMVGKGWLAEGDGPDLVVMCSPASSAGASPAKGVWIGTTDLNETVRAIILDDGTYYLVYTEPGTATDAGVFQGSANTAGGVFSSTDGIRFRIPPQTGSGFGVAYSASLSGSYTPGSSLRIAITTALETRNVTATYVPQSEQPAGLAVAAGSYSGHTGHALGGKFEATLRLNADGSFTGSNPNCGFAGTATPRTSVKVFDWTLSRTSGDCIFGAGPISGVMFYDEAAGQLRGFAPFDGRSDQYFFIGTRR